MWKSAIDCGFKAYFANFCDYDLKELIYGISSLPSMV